MACLLRLWVCTLLAALSKAFPRTFALRSCSSAAATASSSKAISMHALASVMSGSPLLTSP